MAVPSPTPTATPTASAPAPVLVPTAARTQQPPSYAAEQGSGWTLSFDQVFGGTSLDTGVWGTCYPWEPADGCTNFGNSDEYEWYVPSQDQVNSGVLNLVAQQTPTAGRASNYGGSKEYSFRSGMVTTYPSYQFQYGYVQIVARVPYEPGLWPALWLAAANKHWPPEIDIMEHYGTRADYSTHLHPVGSAVQGMFESTPNLSSGWHTFGLYWSPDKLVWYVDGDPVMTATTGIPQQAMYIIANLAVYRQKVAAWPAGTADFAIKSVKVWQGKSYSQSGDSAPTRD